MFGGGVNKTKVEAGGASEGEENRCPVDPGDVCQAGFEGAGQGQFGEWPFIGDWLAIDDNGTPIDADDKVYVGDVNRIQIFDINGVYQGEIAVAGTVQSLATDIDGNLYVVYAGQDGVKKINPGGAPLSPIDFPIKAPSAVAVDKVGNVYAFCSTCFSDGGDPIIQFNSAGEETVRFGGSEFSSSTGLATNLCAESPSPGNLYVTNASESNAFLRAYGTEPIGCFRARTLPPDPIEETSAALKGTVNPKGEAVTECFFEYGITTSYGQIVLCEDPDATEIGTGSSPVPVHADISGLDKGTVYHVRLIAKIGGETEPGADEEFKTLGPPMISADQVLSTADTEASLKALVNPEGFATACSFEYGLSELYGQSTPDQQIGNDRTDHAVLANLEGLEPGETYHWRVVCSNESGTTKGQDRTFTTFRLTPEGGTCANSALRTGASASLPDCRAYEMVSPIDKNGGDVVRELSGAGETGGYVQAAPDGDSLAYTTLSAFADPPNAVNFNQYIASRRERGQSGEGWSSQGVHTPIAGQSSRSVVDGEFGIVREFMAFSPDLCSGWLIDTQTPPTIAEGQVGFPNLYRRDTCNVDAGGFEPVIPSPRYELPAGTGKDFVDRTSVQGVSADSRHTIFAARAPLNEAAPSFNTQLYDRFCPTAESEICQGVEGSITLVSVLPDGSPAAGTSQVGSGASRNLDNAVSEDGSHVYWSSNLLYLRLRPEQGIVGNECEGGTSCTIAVSSGAAVFWTASVDGSKALYSEGEELYEFDLAREGGGGEASRLIATGVKGVAGASEDLSRIYFVSTNELAGAGQNSEGDEAIAGEANLYLEEDGASKEDAFSFIGTLVAGDGGQLEPGALFLAYSVIDENSFARTTRVSADGDHLAFQSRAPLTGYDNTAEDGSAAVEVFAYEAGGELMCVSCNPSGARPSGVRELRQRYSPPWSGESTKVPAAAWIPSWEHPLHASNVISTDGRRLFFNSFDALVPSDANGTQDVYEWEAPDTGSCKEENASFFSENGGCIYLISSGHSSYESEFWEASPDGENVFFTTEESLVKRDPGSIDLYDARVGGGFPEPVVKPECEGETCQSTPPPPEFPGGASATFSGPGNPPKGKRCPKGKRKVRKAGKARCVKKKAKHGKGKQRANANRRAGR